MASAPVDRHICSKHCEKVSKSELINLLSKALSSVTTYKSTEEETKILKLRQHSKDSLSEARLLFADPEIKCNCFYELDGFLSDLSDHEIDDEEFQDIIDYEQDNDNLREQFYNTSSEDLAKELKRNENLISKYCNQEVVKGINIESLAYDNVIKMWTWRDDMADTNTEELTESESSSAQTPDEKCWEQEDTQTVNTTKGKDTAKKEQTSLHSLESLKASDNSIIDISQEPINLSLSQALPEDQTVPDQSINATPDSELYVSQPTPVKKIVSSTQQVITPLDTYLNGLCSSGASFPDSQEAERIKCDVEKMAQSVHKQLADSFTLFSGSSLIKSGSTYEGLKVGEPDEFDFMFYLPLLSDEMIVEVYSPFDTSMFSNYEIQDYSLFRDILMHRELEANSTQITEANFSYEVFLKLKQILKESLQSALLPRWSCVYMPRITKCTAPEKIVAYTFYLTYKGVQFSNLKIGLDFTLCFTKVRDLTLPFREDEINSRLDPEYRGKRHFIIINDKKARQSFSLHEKAILGSYDVDSAQKRCLRVVKYLRDKHLPKIFDHFTETMGSFIPTYWLKVIAFYHFDDKSVQWNPEQLSNNVISIFQTLYQCFTRSLLRDYFFRSDNLMEGWDKHKRLCFKRHVQDKTDEEIGRFGFLSDDCEIYIKIVKALNDLLELLYQVNSGEVEADCIMEAEQQWKTVNDRTYKQELKKWADTYRELLLEEESTVNKVTDRNGHHLNLPAQFQRTEKATDGKELKEETVITNEDATSKVKDANLSDTEEENKKKLSVIQFADNVVSADKDINRFKDDSQKMDSGHYEKVKDPKLSVLDSDSEMDNQGFQNLTLDDTDNWFIDALISFLNSTDPDRKPRDEREEILSIGSNKLFYSPNAQLKQSGCCCLKMKSEDTFQPLREYFEMHFPEGRIIVEGTDVFVGLHSQGSKVAFSDWLDM